MANRVGRHARRFGAIHLAMGLIAAAVIGGLMTYDFVKHRSANVGIARNWDIQGPPCPAVTAEVWAAKHQVAPKTFDYDGDTLGRVAGHVSCQDVMAGGGKGLIHNQVCQFTSPAALKITTPKGDFYFLPGVGRPATVVIEHDLPRCVLASKFTLQGEDKS
ncbi:MAG TPA: hypothetical protein VHN73_00665 [Phenylobacterium sp.]|nr:hypothetical protein [Phenylobacterium sp.]